MEGRHGLSDSLRGGCSCWRCLSTRTNGQGDGTYDYNDRGWSHESLLT